MSKVVLEDYAEFLEKISPEVRGVLDATFQDAARVISPAGLKENTNENKKQVKRTNEKI